MLELMVIRPKNWAAMQHYRDRSPCWIKLHRDILDDYDYHCLPIESKALAPLLWLLASDYTDGVIAAPVAKMAFRLRMPTEALQVALQPLIDAGFFEMVDPATLATASETAAAATPNTASAKTAEPPPVAAAEPADAASGDTETSSRQRSGRPLMPEDLAADGISFESAAELIALRKSKRAPLMASAWYSCKTEIAKAGMSLQEGVDHWLAKGWQGVEANWLLALKPPVGQVQKLTRHDMRRAIVEGLTGKSHTYEHGPAKAF